jgi:hypothetical protein
MTSTRHRRQILIINGRSAETYQFKLAETALQSKLASPEQHATLIINAQFKLAETALQSKLASPEQNATLIMNAQTPRSKKTALSMPI